MQPTDKELEKFKWWYQDKMREPKFLTVNHRIRAWEEWKAIQERKEMSTISRSIGLSSDDKRDE